MGSGKTSPRHSVVLSFQTTKPRDNTNNDFRTLTMCFEYAFGPCDQSYPHFNSISQHFCQPAIYAFHLPHYSHFRALAVCKMLVPVSFAAPRCGGKIENLRSEIFLFVYAPPFIFSSICNATSFDVVNYRAFYMGI